MKKGGKIKKWSKISLVIFFAVVFLVNCPTPDSEENEYSGTYEELAGKEESVKMGALTFDFHFVPGKKFFTGTNDDGSADVEQSFWISETEVTYEVWYAVRLWAESNGYAFANLGKEGNAGTIGAALTSAKNEPVTCINWRDSMVFCNALTECYNANSGNSDVLECVYYADAFYNNPIRSCDNSTTISSASGSQDNPYVKSDADGFRLPTSNEWELAARYITDSNNDGDITDSGEYYEGDSVSGYVGSVDTYEYPEWYPYLWFDYNSDNKTHDVGLKFENALGLYDMSGNVSEWCFDLYDEDRNVRGGHYDSTGSVSRLAFSDFIIPYVILSSIGMRLAWSPQL